VAFPVTFGLFANGLALGLRSLTVSHAVGSLADSYAFGTVEQFATFVRALDFALGFLALDIANSVLWFSAGSMAFRRLADWIANSWAMRIITFPRALRVAGRSEHRCIEKGHC
jgi:hypothetical protein